VYKFKQRLEQQYTGDVSGLANNVSGDFWFDESGVTGSNTVVVDESIEITGLFWQDTSLPRIPYLQTEGWFRVHMRTIFGLDISIKAIESLRQDLLNDAIAKPTFKVATMGGGEYGFYENNTITLSKELVENSIDKPAQKWILFLVMVEEFGHHLDFILRNEYSDIGGDAKGDEGKYYTASFVEYNQLLHSDIVFAELTIIKKGIKKNRLSITKDAVSLQHKTEIYRASQNKKDHSGDVKLQNGKWVHVEFFKIEGMGAVHEAITMDAATRTGTHYDDGLDFGVVWPDVPTSLNDTSVDTNYSGLLYSMDHSPKTLIYKSHNGEYAYWHSMSPDPNLTNIQIRELIIKRASQLWAQANQFRGQRTDSSAVNPFTNDVQDHGVFFIGKLLHMLQDSYAHGHTNRATHTVPDIKYKVKTNDTLESIGIKHGLDWKIITTHNWKTIDKDKINTYLKNKVGCTKKINGNYIFESSNNPGIVSIPMPKRNQVISFQDYTKQNHTSHAHADNGGDYYNNFRFIPGALDARDVSVKILELYRDQALFSVVEKYLLSHVYPFAPGVKNNKSGVNPTCYSASVSDDMLKANGCKVGDTYRELRKEFKRNKEKVIKQLENEHAQKSSPH
jgi:hypothetical protein